MDQVLREAPPSSQPGNGNIWFEGPHLLPLLRKVLTLPDGPETDLLQYLDRLAKCRPERFSFGGYRGNLAVTGLPSRCRIMESLNLLRYLVIRDKVTENQVNFIAVAPPTPPHPDLRLHLPPSLFPLLLLGYSQTGIWTELYKIEDTFLKPLRVGVNMSRAHYKMELHKTVESKTSSTKGQCESSRSSDALLNDVLLSSHRRLSALRHRRRREAARHESGVPR